MRRPVITAHAVRRFAERFLGICGLPEHDGAAITALQDVHGVDVGRLREMLAERVQRGVLAEAPIVRLGGARYVLEENKLVTILQVERRPRRKRPIERERD